MKIKLTTIIVTFLLIVTVWATDGAGIFDFSIQSVGDDVKIEWRTTYETNVTSFIIQRSPVKYDNFIDIQSINPKGDNSYYSYVDNSAYKSSDIIFKYRIEINTSTTSKPAYTESKSVVQNISGVKRTWGSIKAMFR